MKLLLSLIIIVCSLSSVGLHSAAVPEQTSRVLNICELVENWKDYNRRRVRMRAIIVSGAEQTWLYDPKCKQGEALTHVSFRQHIKGAAKRMDQLLAKNRRAWVVLEGVFYGPEPYKNVDPKLPESIKERIEKSPRRYGHMNSFEMMIEVARIIEATEVPRDIPPSKP